MIATDGLTSYAILTYQCGMLRSNFATIGFSISPNFYENHELSRTSNVDSIACLNSPNSVWSNVVYHIGGGKTIYDLSLLFSNNIELCPCINGQCIDSTCICDAGWNGAQCNEGRSDSIHVLA